MGCSCNHHFLIWRLVLLCDIHGEHEEFYCPDCVEMENLAEQLGYSRTNRSFSEKVILMSTPSNESTMFIDWWEE